MSLASNRALPGLRAASEPGVDDVELELGAEPSELARAGGGWRPYVESSVRDAEGRPLLSVTRRRDGGGFHFAYRDGTDFWVDRAGRRVWGRWAANSTLEDTAVYLLGPVLGFVLRLRGRVPLHASAVVPAAGSAGGAVAFAGPAGAGKSTLAAAFAQAGDRVMADDIAVLRPEPGDGDGGRDRLWLEPDSPRLRLWPESVELLFGEREHLAPLTPNWDKRGLALDDGGFEAEPRPLRAVYLLDGTGLAGSGRVDLDPPSARDALLALVANTYAARLLDRDMRRAELELLARLVESVPVRRLPRAGRSPAELRRAVVADLGAGDGHV